MYYEVDIDNDMIIDEVLSNSRLRKQVQQAILEELPPREPETESYIENALTEMKRFDYFAYERFLQRLRDKELI